MGFDILAKHEHPFGARGGTQQQPEPTFCVLPSILSVDISAIVDQALRDFDPAVERRHVEWRAVVVVPSVHQRQIFLQKLPDGSGVVLVHVPENRRGPAHSRFLFLLRLRRR
uniref:Uncharacterized protein n=1 Tax=Quercus lobata TaxID=97700 RepID=A0A7N2MXX5_QUELO